MLKYGVAAKKKHLQEFSRSLEAFLSHVEAVPELQSSAPSYRECLVRADNLLANGFSQEQLSELSRSVPQLFWLHKEWVPPLELALDGRWVEPRWFREYAPKHQAVVEAAEQLRVLGEY